MEILTLLSQRRIWASLFGALALGLSLLGVTLDANGLTEAVLTIIQAISAIIAIVLPIVSYFKPKK